MVSWSKLKIEVVKNKGLFEIGDRGNDLEKYDLDELRDIHASLVEEYVSLNRDVVIIDCFFNLKLEGVYTNNEKLADELIENAQLALNLKDYEELLSIVNVLYELDERDGKWNALYHLYTLSNRLGSSGNLWKTQKIL